MKKRLFTKLVAAAFLLLAGRAVAQDFVFIDVLTPHWTRSNFGAPFDEKLKDFGLGFGFQMGQNIDDGAIYVDARLDGLSEWMHQQFGKSKNRPADVRAIEFFFGLGKGYACGEDEKGTGVSPYLMAGFARRKTQEPFHSEFQNAWLIGPGLAVGLGKLGTINSRAMVGPVKKVTNDNQREARGRVLAVDLQTQLLFGAVGFRWNFYKIKADATNQIPIYKHEIFEIRTSLALQGSWFAD